MSAVELLLATGKSIDTICVAAGLDLESLPQFESGPGLMGGLEEEERFVDAIGFLAHALPTREAVWWAWSCARDAAGKTPPDAVQAALDATGCWISEPTDINRRAAYERAQQADIATPSGCAGAAAFFSGGSIGPPDQPEMAPADYMSAKMIAGAVLLAATAEPTKTRDRLKMYLDQGMQVAERVQLWQSPGSGAHS